ncbi:MAG TPA: PepSY-associated TM helix domain-containing protein [Guyparkeria sp.]|nr:PepSY-associated TM helix domain-containing protein [Guyparkeria sp.]
MHAWLGISLLIPLVLVALSGAGLSFAREVDRVLAPELWTVSPPDGVAPFAPEAIRAAAERYWPAERIVRLEMPRNAQDTALAILVDAEGAHRQVFIDPYRGKPQGYRPLVGDPRGWLGFFHRSLTLGSAGHWLVLLAGAGLFVLYLSGRGGRGSVKKSRMVRVHGRLVSVGGWFWMICAASGLLAALIGSSLDPGAPPSGESVVATQAGWQAGWENACPGREIDTIWWLGDGRLAMRCHQAGSIGPFGVAYYLPSGEMTAAGMQDWLSAIHDGSLFGTGGRVLWFWAMLLLPATMVLGVVAWWRRRVVGQAASETETIT